MSTLKENVIFIGEKVVKHNEMAATLLKIYGSLILKYPNHVSKCNTIGKGKINFHTTAKNFEVKCDVSAFFATVNLICNMFAFITYRKV